MSERAFYIDYSRCIGCQSCVQACAECDTHRGVSMIHLETIQRRESVQTAPQVCMHCEDPICARVCPADAIKKTPDGVVQSSLKPRCIGCSNCVLSCPFGVPKYQAEIDQMMKCDMCYDRTSVDKKPMCATVCPSGALTFATAEEIQRSRRGIAINRWKFGKEEVTTKVFVMVPREVERVNVELVQISPTPVCSARGPIRCSTDVGERGMTSEDEGCPGLQSRGSAQVAAGFSHRMGRRPLRKPPRDGEISHPGLAAAGGLRTGRRLWRVSSCTAGLTRSATSALPQRWSKAGPCCFVIPRMRTHASPCARPRESWSPIRRYARISHAPWCTTKRRTDCFVLATTACSILRASRLQVRQHVLCRKSNSNSGGTNSSPLSWRRDERTSPGYDTVFRHSDFVVTTVVLQLWLLTVSVEALLSGAYKTLVPAAAGSTILLLINAGLLRYVFRFDREAQGE